MNTPFAKSFSLFKTDIPLVSCVEVRCFTAWQDSPVFHKHPILLWSFAFFHRIQRCCFNNGVFRKHLISNG
jgi:hypothetical protein